VNNGVAGGLVVNYDLDALPGDPEVRTVTYPDDNRRYFKKGDSILLLTYRNDPYKPVYDTIKVLDQDNAIGVMHLGEFPNGIVFATFVMARYSYALERMSLEDYQLIAQQLPVIAPPDGEWEGNLIVQQRPNLSLLMPVTLTPFHWNKAAGPVAELRQVSDGLLVGKTGAGVVFVVRKS
jgi:hypothetical protein